MGQFRYSIELLVLRGLSFLLLSVIFSLLSFMIFSSSGVHTLIVYDLSQVHILWSGSACAP